MDEKLYDEFLLALSDVLNDFTDVSHIVDVLELTWSGEQLFWDFLKNCQSRQHNRLAERTFRSQQPIENFEGCTWTWRREHER